MFKKNSLVALIIVAVSAGFSLATDADLKQSGKRGCTDPWPLAVQAYSFRHFTLFEAIEKAEECGIKHIEAYGNQVISKDILNEKGQPQKLWFNVSDEIRQKIKDKLRKHDVEMTNFGVVSWIYGDEKGMRMVFDFLGDMGVKTMLVEPDPKNIPLMDKFAQQYDIRLGMHNHPPRDEKYKYWKPEGVLEALEGTSDHFGVSPDVGHWARSGLNPVEQLKKLEGRIFSVHLKDVDKFGVKTAKDVPLGTGICNVREILEELNRQGFRGVFTIEYESNPGNPVPDIKKCVEFFEKAKAEIKPVIRPEVSR